MFEFPKPIKAIQIYMIVFEWKRKSPTIAINIKMTLKAKKFLAAIMQEELTPIRERRKEFEKDIPAIYEMLRKGCETARATAAATLDDVRKAMKINYFDDVELIAEQAKRFGQE